MRLNDLGAKFSEISPTAAIYRNRELDVGRPKKDRGDLLQRLERYISETPIPIVAEFAYLNDVRRTLLYELYPDTIKKLIDKKESALERGGLNKTIDKTMAIFSLKQLGWRDVQDVNVGLNTREIATRFGAMVQASGAGIATSGDNSVSQPADTVQDSSRGPEVVQDGDSQADVDS